jgi:hypothetical protein
MMITAKTTCSVNAGLRPQLDLKETFVHEMGHALSHPGDDSRMAECKTKPTGSVMCHSVASGVRRSWTKWSSADVSQIRTEVFDTASRRFPGVQCYEYASYQQCDTECINTAGFPNQGATEVYENCRRSYCDKMCR